MWRRGECKQLPRSPYDLAGWAGFAGWQGLNGRRAGFETQRHREYRAARPPTNTSYRSAGMACSRWSRIFVKDFTIIEVSSTEGRRRGQARRAATNPGAEVFSRCAACTCVPIPSFRRDFAGMIVHAGRRRRRPIASVGITGIPSGAYNHACEVGSQTVRSGWRECRHWIADQSLSHASHSPP